MKHEVKGVDIINTNWKTINTLGSIIMINEFISSVFDCIIIFDLLLPNRTDVLAYLISNLWIWLHYVYYKTN